MKILAHCYTYGHNSASGADKMLESLMEYLAERGEECRVVIDDCPTPYTLNGVNVSSNKRLLGEQYDWCDIVIIHLVAMHEATRIAARFNKPVVHICHNNHIPIQQGYVIYNSNWLKEEMKLPLPSIVVHAPTKIKNVLIDHYRQPYITLINTCKNKGGDFLVNLAKQLPQYKFLGVYGGYGFQMMQPVPNLSYRPYNPDGVDYTDTRILIIPSKMESWSLAASEAMAHGIPVICSALPGLRENCGKAAVYGTSIADYMQEIVRLSDYDYYTQRARDGFARVRLHNYNEELNIFYNFIENIVMKGKEKNVVLKTEDGQPIGMVSPKAINKPKKEKKEYKGLPTQK